MRGHEAVRLWSRGAARRFFIRKEPTMNPAPAAAYLLRAGVRRATMYNQGAARRRLTGRRTRTLNPLPALLALSGIPGLSSLPGIGGIAKRFRKPSEARAAAVAPQLVQAANSGNLTAARAIHDRTTFGIAKERAVWLSALAQVSPPIMTEALRNPSVPSVDHSTPESAAASALANAFFAGQGTAGPGATLRVNQSALATGLQVAGVVRGAAAPRARGARGTASAPLMGDPADWTKAQRRRAGLTTVKVKRWDVEGQRSVSVWADSPEAQSWPTVSRGRAELRRSKELLRRGEKVGGALLPAAGTAALAGGRAVVGLGAAAGLGATATVAAVGAAFAVGYAIGSGINALIAYLSPDQVNERKALAFRQARKDWATQHGRPMTAQEVRDMGAGFKQATAEYRAQIGSQR